MSRRIISLLACMLFILTAFVGPLSPYVPKAAAADNDAPNASLDNVSPRAENSTPQGGHVHFIRKQGQWAGIQPFVDLKAYYPDTVSQWNSLYLQLVPGSNLNASDATDNTGHNFICDVITTNMTNAGKDQFLIITLKSLGPNGGVQDTKQYYIKAGQVCKTPADTQNQQNNDPGNQLYARYKLPAKPSAVDIPTGKYVVDVNIKYGDGVNGPAPPVDSDQGIRFVVKAPYDPNIDSNNDAQIGQLGNLTSTENFSVLGDWDIHDRVDATNLSVPFGQCDAFGGVGIDHKNVRVTIYDADDGLFTHDVRFRVRDMEGNDKNTNANGYVHFNAKGTDNAGPGSWGNGGADDTTYYPPNGSGKTVGGAWAQMPTFLADEHYQLEVYGLNARNTIDIGLPGDAIFGTGHCHNITNPFLDCTVKVPAPTFSTTDTIPVTMRGHANQYGGNPPTKVQLDMTVTNTAISKTWTGGADPADPNANSYIPIPAWSIGPLPLGQYTINADAIDKTPGTGKKDTCTTSFTVTAKPYVSIYGGDAEAGVSPDYDAATGTYGSDINNSASFVGWNDDAAGPWGSAGAQWAVQALGSIAGFPSGRGVGTTATKPWYLSFANSPLTNYGGQFGDTSPIRLDYSAYTKSATAFYPNGNSPGPYELGSQVVATKTIVAKGNIYISGRLIYSTSGSWAQLSDIPSYKLIALGGNIYINNLVDELDGTYMAIPTATGTGGNVYTCSTKLGPGVYAPVSTASLTYYSDCKHQLKIFGSVIAKHIYFGRTSGSFTANQTEPWNANNAAESIIYGPESWLSSVNGGSSSDSAITGLPPIL